VNICKFGQRFAPIGVVLVVLSCLFAAKEASAVGQSAVVTLGFPVGSRPTAMGEAFTGLANDANAIFYNPAGLGQSPLTLSWKTYMADSAFTALAARTSAAFGSRDYVWAGSRSGITRFNGKIWEKGEAYIAEEGEALRSVALKYFDVDHKEMTDNALWEIRRENKLGMKRYERLVTLLEPYAAAFKSDSALTKSVSGPAAVDETPKSITGVKNVAVVETDIDAQSGASDEWNPAEIRQVTAELRREAVKNLPLGKYNIMTSETVYAQGSAVLEECADENCVIALGSKIGADYIVRGTLSKLRTMFTLSVEIYETENGNLVASSDPVRSENIVELVEKATVVCADMYKTFLNAQNSLQKMSKEAASQKSLATHTVPDVSFAAFNVRNYARMLILLPPDESVSSNIAGNLLPKSMSEQERKSLADKITEILESEDRGIADVTELLIPFTIAVRDTVTAMALDASERLWVGTVSGLWRRNNGRWRHYTAETGDEDGVLPSDRVTAVAVSSNGDVAVGTEKGLAIMKDSEWYGLTSENGLPDSYITSLAFAGEKLYIGTPRGLAVKSSDNSVAVFDTSSGLLSLGVTALFVDSKGRLWIGGDNGITIYTPSARTWTRYKFPGSTVYSFAEQNGGVVWIGTNKGVITHKAGKTVTGKDGRPVNVPEWKTYHSKNALKNDNVSAIAACGKDMWVATEGAMHQYAHAEKQLMLFYEQILPAFQMSDLWHGFPAVVIPTEDWGTLAFSMNFINMGDNEQWDELEAYLGKARSWEGVFGISYGFPVKEDLSLGLNAKYVYSVLDSKSGGVGQTFAIDAAVLKRNFFVDKLDIGFMLQNMGPSIYYMTPEEADPIPFSLRLGLAYRPIRTPFHELTLVFDAYREVVKNYYDKGPDPFWVALWTGMLNNKETTFAEEFQEINVSLGMEYLYADFMALRLGFLGDYLGERFELSMGLGVKYANMNVDFSYIYSPPGFMGGIIRAIDPDKEGASGVRDGQWRLSFLFGF